MKKRIFTEGISAESLDQMIICFDPLFRSFSAGETILAYSDSPEHIGILLEGDATLHYIDEQGDSSMLEVYGSGDIFGEIFSLPLDNYEYIVSAQTDCRVIFISYDHLITPCEKACAHHSRLISNLFLMTAQKSQELSLHISFLSQHTTRKKLLAYLHYARSLSGASRSQPFEIPMTLGGLAEYLCVDRTAMMREIRLLKQDGVLDSDRRRFRLLKDC
ncbi:MAG: Crp/Fnr family transcriptional regulator [Emergencia sp.]